MIPILPAPLTKSTRPAVLSSLGPTALSAPPEERLSRPEPRVGPSRPRPQYRAYWVGACALLGFVAALDFAMPKEPRYEIVSGRAGPKMTPSGSVERWWQTDLQVTVDGSFDALGPTAHDVVLQSFGAWIAGDASLPKVTFDAERHSAVPTKPDGENRIYFTPIRVEGHENDLGITLTYLDDESGEILEADVVINSKLPFALLDEGADPARTHGGRANSGGDSSSDGSGGDSLKEDDRHSCQGSFDLQSVVTHEAGHFFGLGEDMTNSAATMFFSTQPCNTGKRTLSDDDTAALVPIYAQPVSRSRQASMVASAGPSCSVGPMRSDGNAGLLFLLGAAVAIEARRASRRR